MIDQANGAAPRLVLPRSLVELHFDCRVAEVLRLLLERVRRRGGTVESAFLLWGHPPTARRSGRVIDLHPLDSCSSAGHVAISAESIVRARAELLRSHPGPDRMLAIAHSHPEDTRPVRSQRDQVWHRTVLDMCQRPDLILEARLERRDGPGGLPATAEAAERLRLQVFYSTILPSSGDFHLATTYLLARPLDGFTGDLEIEVAQALTETVAAEEALSRLEPAVVPAGPDVLITYGAAAPGLEGRSPR